MILTEQELKKAARILAATPRAKGLSQKLMRAASSYDPIKVKHPRVPVTVNKEQGLYVIPAYDGQRHTGYSCIGFDVAIRWANGYHQWLVSEGRTDIPSYDVSLRGTIEGYYEYRRIADIASRHNVNTGHKCPSQLTPQLIGLEGKRVEVVTTYDETRRFIVGKSTGWCPIHLEIANRSSHGGGAAEHEYKSVRQV